MGQFDLNLSTRPFRAYQLKSLLLAVALIVLVGLSTWQAYGFVDYRNRATKIRSEQRDAQVNAEALNRQLGEVDARLNRPEVVAKLTEIGFLNEIIARKHFSWTRVFATIENLIPDAVHLVSLSPSFMANGDVLLHVDVKGRTIGDVKDFIEVLESSPVFEDVNVSTEEKLTPSATTPTADVAVSLAVKYHPEKESQ